MVITYLHNELYLYIRSNSYDEMLMENSFIRVEIIEDDNLIRDSFKSLMEDSPRIKCIADYSNCEDAIKNLSNDLPDVLLMDIQLPGINGIEGTRRIKKAFPSVDIIIVTVNEDDEKIFSALCAGANGYLTKNVTPKKLIDSISEVYSGGAPMSTTIARKVIRSFQLSTQSPLTTRETEVLQQLSKGKSYTMIAEELFISKETVRTHIKNIYQKLNVNSKSAALDIASKSRLI